MRFKLRLKGRWKSLSIFTKNKINNMNQIKTYIDRSGIEGIGLFAGEFIPKGTLIWKPSGLDQVFSKEQLENLSQSLELLSYTVEL